MHCPSCGSLIANDARFCTRCGATTGIVPPPYRDRVARHLQSLGVLWLIYAVLRAISGAVGLAFLHGFMDGHNFDGWSGSFPHMWAWGVWPFAGVAIGIGVAGALITAFALLTRQPWGRVVAIVFAVLALLHPIFGTVLGIYTLWVLAPRLSGDSYDREVAQRRGF